MVKNSANAFDGRVIRGRAGIEFSAEQLSHGVLELRDLVRPRLSPREHELLTLLARGLSEKAIAEELVVSR